MSFVCHNDRQLGSFMTTNILIVLDTTTKGTVHESQARSDDSEFRATSFDSRVLGLIARLFAESCMMRSAYGLSN